MKFSLPNKYNYVFYFLYVVYLGTIVQAQSNQWKGDWNTVLPQAVISHD